MAAKISEHSPKWMRGSPFRRRGIPAMPKVDLVSSKAKIDRATHNHSLKE